MDRKKAIDLVRKVLAKTNNNSSEHEVEVAMLKVQELLVKYNLTMSEVSIDSDKSYKKEISDDNIYASKKLLWWEKHLGKIVAKNFRCESVTANDFNYRYVNFIGLKEDVEIATELYLFARKSLEYFSDCYVVNLCNKLNITPMKKRPEHLRKFVKLTDLVGEKNNYIEGFLKGLDNKFIEQVEKNNWGLILMKDKAVIDYIDTLNFKKGRQSDYKTSCDSSHYKKGYKQGYNLSYDKGLLE